jgi:hypothetical protein
VLPVGRIAQTQEIKEKKKQIFVGHAHDGRLSGRHNRICEDNIKLHLSELVVKMPTVQCSESSIQLAQAV